LTDVYKRLPGPKNKEARLKEIQRLAKTIVKVENRKARMGRFSPTKNRQGLLWRNYYEAMHKGTRIKMEGTFDGKSLKFRKNWPKNEKGQIDWSKIDPSTKEPAWKSIKFKDTKVPDAANPGKFKTASFTYDNLGTQVDEAFGKGFFTRSTTPYVAQKELWGKTYKGEPIGKYVTRANIIKYYQSQKGNAGKMPTEKYISQRMSAYAPAQVHHWGEEGVKGDPYRTQLTSRTANQAVNVAEQGYEARIRKAGNDPVKIAEAKKWFKNEIKNISKEHGGIKYTVDGKVVGGKASEGSILATEGHQAFNELYTSGSTGRKTLKAITSLTGINDYLMANGMDPICVTKSPKKCGMDLIKSEGGVDAYKNALQERVAKATGDERWFKAFNNPKMASVKNFFKGAGKKLWKWGKAGVIGELYYIPFGTAYETGRGRNLLEALDNSIGLGGHFGMEEKNLMKYADKAGYSDEDKKFFSQFAQLDKNDNWTMFWQMAAAGDKWAMEKIGKFYPGVPLWDLQEHAAGKIKDLETESEDIIDSLYTGLGDEGVAGKWEEREHLKDVQTIDWINKAKEKEANVLINRDIMKKFKERAESEGKDPIWPLTPPAEKRWLVGENLVDAFTQDEWVKKILSGEQKLKTEEAGPLWSTLTSPVGAAVAAGDKRIDEERRRKILEEAGREDLLYKEYMHPLYGASFSMPQAGEQGRYGMFAGGGIAGLSGGKRFGPPPLSGPMPQGGGLSSQFNRVKKLTG